MSIRSLRFILPIMLFWHLNQRRSGQSLIEVVIASSLLALIISGGVALVGKPQQTVRLSREYSVATALAVEGMEAARAIAGRGYSSLLQGTYGLGLDATGSFFQFVASPDVVGSRYTRSIVIQDRDTTSKNVTVQVAWTVNGAARDVTLTSILSNWR
jgi:hypothetical protein